MSALALVVPTASALGSQARTWEPAHVQPVVREPQIADDAAVVAALRRGDEAAFTELVTSYSSSLLRLAMDFCRTRSVAEEVVQETWLAVLNGIARFEGRSSLKT